MVSEMFGLNPVGQVFRPQALYIGHPRQHPPQRVSALSRKSMPRIRSVGLSPRWPENGLRKDKAPTWHFRLNPVVIITSPRSSWNTPCWINLPSMCAPPSNSHQSSSAAQESLWSLSDCRSSLVEQGMYNPNRVDLGLQIRWE